MSLNGTSRVILVIEDEWLVRDAIAEALRDAGWEVLEAASAEEAIALMQTGRRVDVVFTDIQLAGQLCGWDLAEHYREARPDVPIIYTSGNTADRSRQVHGSVFLNKPYQVTAVIEWCQRLC